MTMTKPANQFYALRASPGPVSVTSIGLDDETSEFVKRFAEAVPMVRLRPPLPTYYQEDVRGWIGNPPPDICLLDFDQNRSNVSMVAERIHGAAPETSIFAISRDAQSEMVIEAMRSGCSEYLRKPLGREEFLNALARVSVRKKEEKKAAHTGQVFTFIGAKGGCGVTTLVTLLGALLSKDQSRRVLLIDFHADFGDAGLYLRLPKYRHHSFELVENIERLDTEFLQGFLVHHPSGLTVIPAPEGQETAHEVLPGDLVKTLEFLRPLYDLIIIDSAVGLTEQNLELVRYSDQTYIVTVAEVSALRNVVRHLDYFAAKQTRPETIRVVLNRHNRRDPISEGDIEKAIRRKIFWKVPNQYSQIIKLINSENTIPHLSNSEVIRNLQQWSEVISNKRVPPSEKKDSNGILGFLSRGAKQ
jgi:pilus assembly protein CpaE